MEAYHIDRDRAGQATPAIRIGCQPYGPAAITAERRLPGRYPLQCGCAAARTTMLRLPSSGLSRARNAGFAGPGRDCFSIDEHAALRRRSIANDHDAARVKP